MLARLKSLFAVPWREFMVCDNRTFPFTVLAEFDAPDHDAAVSFARHKWPDVPDSALVVMDVTLDV